MELHPLPETDPALDGYRRPKLMAIGDSIFNGTRSLTTDAHGARHSPPAQVAGQMGIDFKTPAYPWPILFDLEQGIRQLTLFDDLIEGSIDNAKRWRDFLPQGAAIRFHDNVAVAGHTYQDLWTRRSETERQPIADLIDQAEHRALPLSEILGLYFAINNAFVLSPANHPAVNGLSALEQVASRQPERLLINIGSNNGVFMTGLLADIDHAEAGEIDKIPGHAAVLADCLARYCGKVDHIYFNHLIRPRVIANLRPREYDRLGNPPTSGGYFERYIADLLNDGRIDRDAMAAFDRKIADINKDVEKEFASAFAGNRHTKVHFIDVYKKMDAFDTKHFNDRLIRQEIGGKKYNCGNFPYYSLFGIRRGTGLFSLDNMHPTILGYNVLSNEILRVLNKAEGKRHKLRPWTDSITADSLVMHPPGHADGYKLLLGLGKLFFRL